MQSSIKSFSAVFLENEAMEYDTKVDSVAQIVWLFLMLAI